MSEASKEVLEAATPNGRYAAAQAARLFNLPESRLRYWAATGFIVPSLREGRRRYYSFHDLLGIKVAKELLDRGLPLQRVRRSLHALRAYWPRVEQPLSRLRLRTEGSRILVDEGRLRFDAETGQALIDFDVREVREEAAAVLQLRPQRDEMSSFDWEDNEDPPGLFVRGLEYEEQAEQVLATAGADPQAQQALWAQAKACYEQALELDPEFAAAWTNLGALFARLGDLDAARDHFDRALELDPDQLEARCNLAELALRGGEPELAIEAYRHVLREEPEHLEASYGLARALLAVGGRGQARAWLSRFVAGAQRGGDPPELRERVAQARRALEALDRSQDGPL